MKIGILQTDSVLAQFRQKFEDYPKMFESLLLRVDKRIKFTVYDVSEGGYPDNPNECDGYIITGSKASVYEEQVWIKKLQDYLVQLNRSNKKLVAICFGHQLIAEAFGGKTEKSLKGWGVGVHTIHVKKTKAWMKPVMSDISVIVSHQDQVTQLPPGAELIASSEFCTNSMFQLDENILAMQGHPEFSKSYAETMMRYRADNLGLDTINAGLTSLENAVDDQILAKWIVEFFRE